MVTIKNHPIVALVLLLAIAPVHGNNTSNATNNICAGRTLTCGDPENAGGTATEVRGIMFDVESNLNDDKEEIMIDKISLRIDKKVKHTVQVFTKPGSHVGVVRDETAWRDLGTYHVEGKGRRKDTVLSLDPSQRVVLPRKGLKQAFYVLQIDDNDIQTFGFNSSEVGSKQTSNEHLTTYVGTGRRIRDSQEISFLAGKVVTDGRGFCGSIQYHICEKNFGFMESKSNSTFNTSSGTLEDHSSNIGQSLNTGTLLAKRPMRVFQSSSQKAEAMHTPLLDATQIGLCETHDLVTEISDVATGTVVTKKVKGIMFDLESTVDDDKNIVIESFGIHIDKKENHTLQVFAMNGTHKGHVKEDSGWRDLGTYNVTGLGASTESVLTLKPSERLVLSGKNDRKALYIIQHKKSNIRTLVTPITDIGTEHSNDGQISVLVGTGRKIRNTKELDRNVAFRDGSVQEGLRFFGRVLYRTCDASVTREVESNSTTVVDGANSTGLTANATIKSTSMVGDEESLHPEGSFGESKALISPNMTGGNGTAGQKEKTTGAEMISDTGGNSTNGMKHHNLETSIATGLPESSVDNERSNNGTSGTFTNLERTNNVTNPTAVGASLLNGTFNQEDNHSGATRNKTLHLEMEGNKTTSNGGRTEKEKGLTNSTEGNEINGNSTNGMKHHNLETSIVTGLPELSVDTGSSMNGTSGVFTILEATNDVTNATAVGVSLLNSTSNQEAPPSRNATEMNLPSAILKNATNIAELEGVKTPNTDMGSNNSTNVTSGEDIQSAKELNPPEISSEFDHFENSTETSTGIFPEDDLGDTQESGGIGGILALLRKYGWH